MEMFGTLVLIGVASGVLLGLVYALLSTGFNFSLGVSRVVNLQHGALILWTMYAAYYLHEKLGWDPYLALVVLAPLAFAELASSRQTQRLFFRGLVHFVVVIVVLQPLDGG